MQTARLGFSRWQAKDAPLAHDLWEAPEVGRYIMASGQFTAHEAQQRLALEIRNEKELGLQYWPLFLLADDTFVGCCGLRPWQEEGIVELGFHIHPRHWGHGYATEAAHAVLEHAFGPKGFAVVASGHHPQNVVSQRVLQKLGFVFLADMLYAPTGLRHPTYLLQKDQWLAL